MRRKVQGRADGNCVHILNAGEWRGSECESASTVVDTPESDHSPSLKLKHYQPQLARFEPDPSQSRNQGQDHLSWLATSTKGPVKKIWFEIVMAREHAGTAWFGPHEVVAIYPGCAVVSATHEAGTYLGSSERVACAPELPHPHQQYQQPIATKTRPRANSDVEGQRWHQLRAVPLPAHEKEGEETVLPGYGNVSVSRRLPPSPSSLPRAPPLKAGGRTRLILLPGRRRLLQRRRNHNLHLSHKHM
ncbi:hypothetical protein LshimejAT787_1801890 [Lyophyllum shimeji]|uniref:Uncharacterized protein n=1 Tax=Lyophyllum shimeji TaxID=47721 RepID=A0A9P3Q102_LYOSH|nr:hypothetical protein LshimejAT787_1801890 [Lyophyllum shimeji]